MPALWSPEDLAARFAPYIEELHDVFAMHGLHYGLPDDIQQLASRLETHGALNEELAALVRSMVLREGGSIPRTDLLEIVAIAIAGPRMDRAGEELQPSVRQLLAFLHTALKRPWNEPPGTDGVVVAEKDMRAEAARELREAAARIEAEARAATAKHPEPEVDTGPAAQPPRANVIPFGRARAVFSRLARDEAAELTDEMDAAEIDPSAELVGAPSTMAAPQAGEMVAASTLGTAPENVHSEPRSTPAMDNRPAMNDRSTRAIETPGAAAPDQVPARSASPVPAKLRPQPAPLPEFDEEPPLPAAPPPAGIAFVAGVAAAVLATAVLTISVHSWRAMNAKTPAKVEAARSNRTAPPAAPANSVTSPPADIKPKPEMASGAPGPARHFDDDYIAPPYSVVPGRSSVTGPAPAMVSASAQPVVMRPAPLRNEASVGTSPVPSAGVAAGFMGTESQALSMPPIHPRVAAAIMAENLIAAPKPDYPMLAKLAHVDGPVVLRAEITRSGAVADTQVISGHHLLRHAAEDAVRHWRYRPYQVDGKPVPVSTTITVRFRP